MIQNATEQCLHLKHRELDFAGMNMKKDKKDMHSHTGGNMSQR